MAREYYQFTKKHFEYELKGITYRNKLKPMIDITEEWKAEGNETWEHIYKIPTRNPAVDIIIFSSIDINLASVRDYGADAVRVIYKWATKKGVIYKSLHTHQRIKTLFQNLESTLINANAGVFNLNYGEFSKAI